MKKAKWIHWKWLLLGIFWIFAAVLIWFLQAQKIREEEMQAKVVLYDQEKMLKEEIQEDDGQIAQKTSEIEELKQKQKTIDEEIARLREKQEQLSILEEDRKLYDLAVGKLEWNYDVAMFKELQKTSSQAGTIGKVLLGGLFGTVMQSSQQDNMDRVYQNRIAFYQLLSEFIKDSAEEVSLTKAEFDSCFGFWDSLREFQSDEDILRNRKLLEKIDGEVHWAEEKNRFIQALGKYYSDLNEYIMFYDMTISSRETEFIAHLQEQSAWISDVFYAYDYDPDQISGYTPEEKIMRYIRLLTAYRNTVDFMVSMSQYDDGIIYEGDRTAYHAGFFRAYGNKGRITYIQECSSSTFALSEVEKRYYDQNGIPLYLSLEQGDITLYHGEIVEHTCINDGMAEMLVEEARRIWNEYPDKYEFEHNYQNYQV